MATLHTHLQRALNGRSKREAEHLRETLRRAEKRATQAALDAAVADAARMPGQGTSPTTGKDATS